jgi:vacuolar protein sorting-associated protein 13A/C
LDVRADGQKQALRITNYEPQHSLYKPRRFTASHDRKNSTMSSTDAFEAVTEEVTETLVFRVEFAGIGISLVNRKMVEVIYVTVGNLKFEYTDSNIAQAVTLSCSSLQIDNQLHDALYPVILQPTPIPKESSGVAALPTVQASVIWLKDQGT